MSSNPPPTHGNYHSYYLHKRPASIHHDPRLALLPPATFLNKRVLDIGCNEGLVSIEIAQRYKPSKVVGVDVGETLIAQAWKRRRTAWCLQEPPSSFPPSTPTSLPNEPNSTRKRKRLDSETELSTTTDIALQPSFFPSAFEHLYGPLPIIPPSSPTCPQSYPHNISFYTADWHKDRNVTKQEDSKGYDVVLAFSITKWIHINDLDDGLVNFFKTIHEVLLPNGLFIVEPQEWESYKHAKRMNQILADNAKKLQIRPDDFARILSEIGFVLDEHYGSTGAGGLKRGIFAYRKKTL